MSIKSTEARLTEDSSTAWVQPTGDSAHFSANDDFGGGTITLQQRVQGVVYTLLDDETAITKTAAFDMLVAVRPKDVVRMTLSGSTDPDLKVKITS